MPSLWIVLVSAEGGERSFNVIVHDDDRARAEMTAETVVRNDGWANVRLIRSGLIAEERLSSSDKVFQDSAAAARDLGWALIRYRPAQPS